MLHALVRFVLACVLAGPFVQIQTTEGRVIEGELLDTLPDAYLVRTGEGGSVRVPFGQVVEIKKRAGHVEPVVKEAPRPDLWQLESRTETVSSEDERGAHSVQRKFLVVREGNLRDVPALEIIGESGAADLKLSFDKTYQETAQEKVWAHLSSGAKLAIGLCATAAGVYFLTRDYGSDDDQTAYYTFGGFSALIGLSLTIDTPFSWHRRIKEIDGRLHALEQTPDLDRFMRPERARDEIERHNTALLRH